MLVRSAWRRKERKHWVRSENGRVLENGERRREAGIASIKGKHLVRGKTGAVNKDVFNTQSLSTGYRKFEEELEIPDTKNSR